MSKIFYYGNNDYRDYLAHHGILGMKWGIRRFQPYSIKPRESGKGGKEIGEARAHKKIKVFSWKHPEVIKKEKLNKAINTYLDKSSAISQYQAKANSVKKDLDTMESMFDKKQRSITAQNQDPISDAGLKAFFKMQGYYDIGWEDSYDKETPDTKASLQEWFSFEDQTIGLWEISDLVKKGNTAKDIRNMMDTYDEKQRYLYSELDKVKKDVADHMKANPDFNQFSSSEINHTVSTEVEKRVSADDYHEHLWAMSEADRQDVPIDKYVSFLEEEFEKDKERLDLSTELARTMEKYNTAKYSDKLAIPYSYDYDRVDKRDLEYDLRKNNKPQTKENLSKYYSLKNDAKEKYDAYNMHEKTADPGPSASKRSDELWNEYEEAERKRKAFLEED